jgi:hypothetical protein
VGFGQNEDEIGLGDVMLGELAGGEGLEGRTESSGDLRRSSLSGLADEGPDSGARDDEGARGGLVEA